MLAAENGHKDVVLILTQRGANLDLINAVSFLCICFNINPKGHHFEPTLVTT